MDLNELNKQMDLLQNDFHQYKTTTNQNTTNQPNTNNRNTNQFNNSEDINFQPIKNTIDTKQIKRPTKTGEHRNDINEKMSMMNTTYFEPDTYNSQSPDMLNKEIQNLQSTRNNSNYINNINNIQSNQSRIPQKTQTNQNNNFANYYNNNFETLQTHKNTQSKYSNIPNESYDLQYNQMNNNNNINQENTRSPENTHNSGISMLNARNMYSLNDFSQDTTMNNSSSNKIHDTGYHKIEEKKTDYRQNINSKLDNMIFDNPNASVSSNPILNQRNNNMFQKDTRMVIQDSNKDYYRQSSNERMSQYSPLSRSSNIPIHMANMSVNDFYSNMNTEDSKQLIEEEHKKLNTKEMMNNRLNNYTPLTKTVQYETNKTSNTQNTPNIQVNTQSNRQPNTQPNIQPNTQPNRQSNTQQQSRHNNKPQQWNPLDVNTKLQNVVYNQLPIISNSERI